MSTSFVAKGRTRTYGAFSAVLDMNSKGDVTYSNIDIDAPEYQKMLKEAERFWNDYQELAQD